MSVELILMEDVADLGKIGEQVHVADGYARNFLLPRKLAAKATPSVLKKIEERKAQLQKEHEERIAVAKTMADAIAKMQISIAVAAGENDQLYGSVSAQQIAEAITAKGVEIEKNTVMLAAPLHELGTFDVEIKLHAEVRTTVKVSVVRADA